VQVGGTPSSIWPGVQKNDPGRKGPGNSPGVDHGVHKGRELGHQHRVEPLLHRKEDTRDIREPKLVRYKMDEPGDVGRREVDEHRTDGIVQDTDLFPRKLL